jgi:YfiH family protein
VPPAKPVTLQQSPAADAIVSDQPHHMLVVRMADCPTALLADESGRVAAAVHAGWRGIVAGVLPAAVRTFRDRFGVDPARLTAAIGPCIGLQRYEVGPEVAEAFREAGLGEAIDERIAPRPHADLTRAAVIQLQGMGLSPEAIEASDRCTHREAKEFFSYRRDQGQTGHMAAVIAPGPRR